MSGISIQIFVCRQSGNHPLEDLAKSSYKPNMKLQIFDHLPIYF
jgi:hypothetical protein